MVLDLSNEFSKYLGVSHRVASSGLSYLKATYLALECVCKETKCKSNSILMERTT